MLNIIKDFTKTFIEQVIDTFHTVDDYILSSRIGRWWINLSSWRKYWARASFWYILGITSMLAGQV